MAIIPDYRVDPMKAGLVWGILFVPAFVLLHYVREGALLPPLQIAVAALSAPLIGLFWAHVLHRWDKKGGGDAR